MSNLLTLLEKEMDSFSFPDDVLIFPKTSNSSSKKCYTVTLIKDIEYEEVKNFTIFIVNNGLQRLTRDPQTTTIVITDYNGLFIATLYT